MGSKIESKMDIDEEFKMDRLAGWGETKLADVKVGDHLRVTANRYQEPGRKCSHVVVQSITEAGAVFVNSYKAHKFKDWCLRPGCQYRQQKYYKRKNSEKEHDGKCVKCRTSPVELPYWICIYCKNKKKVENMRKDLMAKS